MNKMNKLFLFILFLIVFFVFYNKKDKLISKIDYELFKNEVIQNKLKNITFIDINSSIPKIIHKIYIDKTMTLNNIDPHVNKLFEKIKLMNPEYNLKIWSGNDCKNYINNNFPKQYIDCFDSLKPYAFKADFARYCILYNEGGWYSDLKEDPLVSFNSINNNNYSFIGMVDLGMDYCLTNFCIQNAFFAVIKNHPLIKNCIEKVISNCKNRFYGSYNLEPTGPRLFGEQFENIKVLPNNILFGYYIHDIRGGSHFLNNKKIIIHKCNDCTKGNDWENGNNWIKMWSEKDIFN